jgi:mannose-6-phosphate isomerase
MITSKPYRLKNQIQHYAWGTKNENAFIPKLLGFVPEKDKPYAELWIGAHPKAPSLVLIENREEPLDKLIAKYPYEILGKKVVEKFGNKLPYLLKVLSCQTALSIQAHPDKKLAEILHAEDPENYPDENHKPEIAIALDNLKALVGFRPVKEIIDIIEKYPALKNSIPLDLLSKLKNLEGRKKELLKELYLRVMKFDSGELREIITAIREQILNTNEKTIEEEEFIKQYEVYGIDVGLLSILIFNIIELNSGESIYTEAGVPHAYLRGNIIECMANSDNVVRAGLTPKFKDVDTLVEMLKYDDTPVNILRPSNLRISTYKTPFEEFELSVYDLEIEDKAELQSEQIIVGLVVDGKLKLDYEKESTKFSKGESFLIPAVVKNFGIACIEQAKIVIVKIPL